LGIAAALLGDPQTIILDEPVNGLDPEGVLWVRNLVRSLAAEGRTVFLSSHLMSEMAQTADHLLVIGRGKIIADASMQDFLNSQNQVRSRVRTDNPEVLVRALAAPGVSVDTRDAALLEITGVDPRDIARTALEQQVLVYELTPLQASLEEVYMDLTKDEVEYHSQNIDTRTPQPADPALPAELAPAGTAGREGK
ncbi:MAG TPA: ABC transporter ATP-binding protein, partial [Arthrobacter sp.]|nr:ABC transporter ATP-binding protein [Arthrobacter sp.]